MGTEVLSPGHSGRRVKFTTHLHLTPWIIWAKSLLLLYAFIELTGKKSHFVNRCRPLSYSQQIQGFRFYHLCCCRLKLEKIQVFCGNKLWRWSYILQCFEWCKCLHLQGHAVQGYKDIKIAWNVADCNPEDLNLHSKYFTVVLFSWRWVIETLETCRAVVR